MKKIYEKIKSYKNTIKSSCKAREHDLDEQTLCKTVLYRLEDILGNQRSRKDIENFVDTLKVYADKAPTNISYQFYTSVRARLKDILKGK